MAFEVATASNYTDFMRRLRHFMTGRGKSTSVSFTGTGNGTLTKINNNHFILNSGTTPATLTETWEITCTSTTGGGVFSVVGSVSGTKANASVGEAYDNGLISFTIAAGGVPFVVGDKFTFSTTRGAASASGQAWEYVGDDASGIPWFKGKGMTGTENIFFCIYGVESSALDYYNVVICSAVSFNALADNINQPGRSPSVVVSLWNDTIPYWFVLNGQRIVFVGKVSTTYHAGYCGKIFPYSTPTEYAYPVYVGGESNLTNTRWSSISENVRHFVDPGFTSSYMYAPSGTWEEFSNFYETSGGVETIRSLGRCVWPYATGNITNATQNRLRELRDNIDGTYTLLPLILVANAPHIDTLGEIDGCYYVSGHGNAAENVINVGGDQYLVIQNIHRTSRWNYWALKLA